MAKSCQKYTKICPKFQNMSIVAKSSQKWPNLQICIMCQNVPKVAKKMQKVAKNTAKVAYSCKKMPKVVKNPKTCQSWEKLLKDDM